MIKLSDIRKELPMRIQKNMHYGHLGELVRDMKTGRREIDFDIYLPTKNKNLQRDFCWTLKQKQELILSVIKGTDIPPFTIINYTPSEEKSHLVFRIVDGKQRLSSLIDFCNDKFQLELLGNLYYYSELPKDIVEIISRFDITVNQAYEYWDDLISDDDKITWFEMINFAGTPQDIKHLENLKS